MNKYPILSDTIDVNQMEDGFIIYQHSKNKVHYLNHTAAVVFELCDGKTAIDAMPQLIQELFDLKTPPDEEVKACLQSMLDENLIELQ